ncbi:MAG TPA: AmmeMemoRadiSam system protein B [Deltaproteobacteria bacterium]|jgi:AmmeMemoRadiSam system protein B|nr:AmmeMemoRadiSam system protein B [Deltaproteobacteria bacterium]HRW79429.1 AmmeMemoRadiSam system protein B [Desulfomonilia bacterium]NMD41428.1 AmmeMemoRadiSam system protein B [Deltaproteobacteria bacterium]HNQ85469.1 AmmeMemoRadiSam system protein B [Deltaproteobacteria bacterium]HNS88818.1 AmmeMemoRadiSam system protein B [Deltaproteobacteria bacterium]
MAGPVRRPVIAGSWYPGNPENLTRDINRYLKDAVVPEFPAKPVAIIVPHAGYMYSGPVAAYAYKAISGHGYSTVVVISPSHRAYFPFVSVWPRGSYETPLGPIEVDEDLCTRLLGSPDIQDDTRPHSSEHALEIQLPFLQNVLSTFRLCPLIMGRQDLPTCENLASALYAHVKDSESTLIVASSDLSHFHSSAMAEKMDRIIAEHIEADDVNGLSTDLERSSSEACGGGPIMTALLYGRHLGRTSTKVLRYAHSGHITGDNSSVVGYLAAVVY